MANEINIPNESVVKNDIGINIPNESVVKNDIEISGTGINAEKDGPIIQIPNSINPK